MYFAGGENANSQYSTAAAENAGAVLAAWCMHKVVWQASLRG